MLYVAEMLIVKGNTLIDGALKIKDLDNLKIFNRNNNIMNILFELMTLCDLANKIKGLSMFLNVYFYYSFN
jgi:hypothetical protein